MNDEIDPEILDRLLLYDKNNGIFFWRFRDISFFESERIFKSWNSSWSGLEAFTAYSDGYKVGSILGRPTKAHRVAWAMTYRKWPEMHIDHINGNRCDNRISNLRLATESQNKMNEGLRSSNNSGIKGVSWNKSRTKWESQIVKDGKKKFLGYFSDPEAAREAYDNASRTLHAEFSLNNEDMRCA